MPLVNAPHTAAAVSSSSGSSAGAAAAVKLESAETPGPMDTETEDDEPGAGSTVIAVENTSPEVIHVVSVTSAPSGVTHLAPQQVK